MSIKDRMELRNWMKTNPGLPSEFREFFNVLDRDLRTNDIWSTTTTTSSSSSTSSTGSTASTTSSSYSTTSTQSTTSSTSSTN